MSALEIRGEIASGGDFYLVPLAKVGDVAKHFDGWVSDVVEGIEPAILIYQTDDHGQRTDLIAAGYQTTRCQQVMSATGEAYTWDERILVVRSLSDANKQLAALERNIALATEALFALTPQPKPGHRQVRSKAQLIQFAEAILTEYGVANCLSYTFVKQQSVKTQYIGPGRGSANRKKRQMRKTRYQITAVIRDETTITQAFCRMGWKLYATNHKEADLPIDQAVKLYRAAPRMERHFHLFKDAPIGIEPMYVRNDDQILGLCRLLSLCVRLMTLIEIVIRRHLLQHDDALAGLYEGNPNRKTPTPTAVKLLRAFGGIERVQFIPDRVDGPYTTPLTPLQLKILSMLGIDSAIYQTAKAKPNTFEAFGRKCGQILAHLSHIFNRVINRPQNS